jgi:hypothetical protein
MSRAKASDAIRWFSGIVRMEEAHGCDGHPDEHALVYRSKEGWQLITSVEVGYENGYPEVPVSFCPWCGERLTAPKSAAP